MVNAGQGERGADKARASWWSEDQAEAQAYAREKMLRRTARTLAGRRVDVESAVTPQRGARGPGQGCHQGALDGLAAGQLQRWPRRCTRPRVAPPGAGAPLRAPRRVRLRAALAKPKDDVVDAEFRQS